MRRIDIRTGFADFGWVALSLSAEQLSSFEFSKGSNGYFLKLGNGVKLQIWGDFPDEDPATWTVASFRLSSGGQTVMQAHQLDLDFMTFFGQSAVEIEAEMLTGGDIFWLGDLQSFSVGPGDDFVLHALGSI
ncbi:MAG: hypothetical protein AB3N24_04975, partial [Leisingera sp.]